MLGDEEFRVALHVKEAECETKIRGLRIEIESLESELKETKAVLDETEKTLKTKKRRAAYFAGLQHECADLVREHPYVAGLMGNRYAAWGEENKNLTVQIADITKRRDELTDHWRRLQKSLTQA